MIRLFEYKIYRIYRTRQEAVPFCRKVLCTLGMLLAITAVCSSCQPEVEGMKDAEENLPATIRLEVRGEEPMDIATRTVDESAVSDLHILVYNSSGELIGQKYHTGSPTVTVNTRSATGCTIYAVANTGKADLFKGYDIHKESYLKSMVYSITDWGDLTHGTNLPMTGSLKNVVIKAGTQSLSAKLILTRMVAKVALNIKVKASSGITITNYSVKNIPSRSYYIPRASEDAVQTTTATHWKESGVITTSGATSASKTFYMFENRRGTKATISAQKDKTAANAPDKATYVVVHGLVGAVAVTWTVYLGENNTSDFNIKRNGNYTYNITLNDIAATDTRVVVDFARTEDLSSAGTANCYLAKKVNTWYKFKATVRGNGAATAALISPTGSALAANAAISPASAELVWETNGHGKIIQGVILKDGYVYFKTGPTTEGNAVIAVKDRSGNVLWSWHIWKTHFNLAEHRLYYLYDLADRIIYLSDGEIQGDYTLPEFQLIPAAEKAKMGLRPLGLGEFADIEPASLHSGQGIWKLNHFHFAYKKQPETLSLENIELPAGNVTAVIGHNGAGKTTLSRCLCGLEKRCKGILEKDGTSYSSKQRLKLCYMVMQDVNHQLFTESVLEEVLLSMPGKDSDESPENVAKAEAILTEMDLLPYKACHPMGLSGGQKQRVAIASAIASERPVILFDEPTSGLDLFHMRQVADSVKGLADSGKTIVIVTHDPEFILRCCNYVIHLENGRLEENYFLQDTEG